MGGETAFTLTVHGVSLAFLMAIFAMLLNQHKVWIRMKDRMNVLWRRHCGTTGDEYVPLENGGK